MIYPKHDYPKAQKSIELFSYKPTLVRIKENILLTRLPLILNNENELALKYSITIYNNTGSRFFKHNS